jgi:hypothetical protein
MFLQRCRLLFKRIYNSFIMFNQDSIAAAQIAQIFGSELLKVQNSARTDGGSVPEIVKMDPKQFLVGQPQYVASRKEEERRIMELLQREAESAYPVSEPPPYTPQTTHSAIPPQVHQPAIVAPPLDRAIINPPTHPVITFENSSSVLERIAVSLERIANAVDKVDVKPKKKTIKRNKVKVSKPTLLNETTA